MILLLLLDPVILFYCYSFIFQISIGSREPIQADRREIILKGKKLKKQEYVFGQQDFWFGYYLSNYFLLFLCYYSEFQQQLLVQHRESAFFRGKSWSIQSFFVIQTIFFNLPKFHLFSAPNTSSFSWLKTIVKSKLCVYFRMKVKEPINNVASCWLLQIFDEEDCSFIIMYSPVVKKKLSTSTYVQAHYLDSNTNVALCSATPL